MNISDLSASTNPKKARFSSHLIFKVHSSNYILNEQSPKSIFRLHSSDFIFSLNLCASFTILYCSISAISPSEATATIYQSTLATTPHLKSSITSKAEPSSKSHKSEETGFNCRPAAGFKNDFQRKIGTPSYLYQTKPK